MIESPKSEIVPQRYEPVDYREGISEEAARESILAAAPGFKIVSMEPLSRGLGSMAFIVNEEYIFRFPRHEKADRSLEVEKRLLPALEKELTLSIPHFEIAGKQKGSDLGFVGYRSIPGVGMDREMMLGSDGKPDPHLTAQITTFFDEIHSFDTATARKLGVPEPSLKARMMGQILDVREYVFPLVQQKFPAEASQIMEKTEAAFDNYLSDVANFDFEPRLIHGDLEAEHVFIDPEKRNATGIIDFGSARLDDPDYDLWRPYFHFGRPFIELLLQQYPHQDPERLYKKMEFFWTAQEGQRAVRAIMIKDEGSANRVLERIRQRLAQQR